MWDRIPQETAAELQRKTLKCVAVLPTSIVKLPEITFKPKEVRKVTGPYKRPGIVVHYSDQKCQNKSHGSQKELILETRKS